MIRKRLMLLEKKLKRCVNFFELGGGMKKLIFAISVFFTSCVLASDIKPIPLVGVKSESAEYSAICSSVKKYCGKNSQTKILKNK